MSTSPSISFSAERYKVLNAADGLTFMKRLRIRESESAYIHAEKRTAGLVMAGIKKEPRRSRRLR